jgi:hypothetical protein
LVAALVVKSPGHSWEPGGVLPFGMTFLFSKTTVIQYNKMKNIPSFLVVPTTVLVSSLFWWLFKRYVHFKPSNGTSVIRQPRIWLLLGLIGAFLCFEFQVWIIFFQFDEFPCAILFAFPFLLFFSMILFYLNWEIVIKSDGFVFRDALRVKREYRFLDVTIDDEKQSSVVRKRSNGRRICASNSFVDNYDALEVAYKAYLKKEKITIEIKDSNIIRQSGLVCVLVVLLCASLSGMLVWMTFSFKPKVWLMTFIAVPLPFVAVWWVLNYVNWRVELKPEGFVFRNSLRVEREYRFSDVSVSLYKERWVVARLKGSEKKVCSVAIYQRNQMALLYAYDAYLRGRRTSLESVDKKPE